MFEEKAKRKEEEQSSSGPAKILYLCDRRRCDNCSEDCRLTSDIRHAKSFKKHGAAFYEDENQQTEREEAKAKTGELIEALDRIRIQQEFCKWLWPKGKWENGFCSICGEEAITEWNETGGELIESNFCPNCGADMRKKGGENHETD